MGKGDIVNAVEYGGRLRRSRVASVGERLIFVCSEREYAEAVSTGRKPDAIGFPLESVEPIPIHEIHSSMAST